MFNECNWFHFFIFTLSAASLLLLFCSVFYILSSHVPFLFVFCFSFNELFVSMCGHNASSFNLPTNWVMVSFDFPPAFGHCNESFVEFSVEAIPFLSQMGDCMQFYRNIYRINARLICVK